MSAELEGLREGLLRALYAESRDRPEIGERYVAWRDVEEVVTDKLTAPPPPDPDTGELKRLDITPETAPDPGPDHVWVEDKGWMMPHRARAYETLGRRVDWTLWSPGSMVPPPLQYKDTP